MKNQNNSISAEKLTKIRIKRLYSKLRAMKILNPGWDGDDAQPPSEEVLLASESVIKYLKVLNLIPSRIESSVENGVGFTFEDRDNFGYAEFLNLGSVCFLMEKNRKNTHVWEVELSNALAIENSFQMMDSFFITKI